MPINASDAESIIRQNADSDFGKFYGSLSIERGPLGVGMLLKKVRFARFNSGDNVFDTAEGPGVVLTHECDVDQQNDRAFNQHLIVCPIILLESFVCTFSNEQSDQSRLRTFLENLGKNVISRVMYIPALKNDFLPFGGLLYLNQLSHTHFGSVSLEQENQFFSAYGLQCFDHKITNHLLRPKSTSLPLQMPSRD
ncbi:MAG: hypothetical protein CMF12_00660 [Idiomarina sp.]|nr:hypothetical protein [Idiomarina sp.]